MWGMWGRRPTMQRAVYLEITEDGFVRDFICKVGDARQEHLTLLETAALLEQVAAKLRGYELDLSWREPRR